MPVEAAVVAVMWHKKILLLQRREDDRSYPGGQMCLPGGRCDPGEGSPDTALRELWEETGLKAPPNELKYMGTYRSTDRKGRVYTIEAYIWKVDGVRPPHVQVNEEHQGNLWVEPKLTVLEHLKVAAGVTLRMALDAGD